MKAMILNGSPKKKGSTSGLLGRAMGCFLAGWEVWHASIHTKKQFPEILRHLKEIDVLILAAPLYVDGIPSHVIEFLQEAEAFCRENHCRFVFYAISNNGFIEGSHNRVHLKMYECWCRRADVAWGGGIGVGGGEMFYVLSIVYPVIFAVFILSQLIRYAMGAPAALAHWAPLLKNLAVYLFLNGGVLYCMARLGVNVRRMRTTKNRCTRMMVPSFLFIPMADLFMILTALFHGKNIFTLLKKDEIGGKAN